jgi:hypothetical protein
MTIQEFLFSFTFVFGVIYLITHTKIFDVALRTFTEAIFITKNIYLKHLGYVILYLSLFYQSFFWAKFFNLI